MNQQALSAFIWSVAGSLHLVLFRRPPIAGPVTDTALKMEKALKGLIQAMKL